MLSKSRLKDICALKRKKYRADHKKLLVEGYRLCEEAICSDFVVESLLIQQSEITFPKAAGLIRDAKKKNIEIIEITKNNVKKMAETVSSQGVFCVVQQKISNIEQVMSQRDCFIVISDAIQDPGNLGTLIRTCDWFCIDALLLCAATVELYNPKVVRATMGSIFHLPIIEEIDLQQIIPQLKSRAFQIYAADVSGKKLCQKIKYKAPLALILGNENQGIEKSVLPLIDNTVRIQSYGKAESLNVAVAGAIFLHTIKTKLAAAQN